MFIRCRKYPNSPKKVLTICESQRHGEKVVQKTIKYLGVAHNEDEYQALYKIGQIELKALKMAPEERKTNEIIDECGGALLGNMIEIGRIIDGLHDICGPMYDRLGLASLLSPYRYGQLRDVLIARIANPESKLETSALLKRDYNRHISEHQIYRLMDNLVDQEENIKLKVFEFTKSFYNSEIVEILFFDVTTLYFESQKSDELRNNGYSKDHKVGEVQVVLALATTSKGLPIGYKLFPGNTAEVKTLLACVQEWKITLKIDRIVIVADRAMMSKQNLELMEEMGLQYIIAAKLKSLPKTLKEEIVGRQKEKIINTKHGNVLVQEHQHCGRRLVVGYSESRATKDKGDRDRLIKKIKTKLGADKTAETRKLITNTGYLKYMGEKKEGEVIFDEEKVKEEARWDGLHGIITNDKDSPADKLLERYRDLWVIEESFRINKNTLEMRPIYHFTPRRIKAHILLCYISFAMCRYIQEHVRSFDKAISIEKIINELRHIQTSMLQDETTGEEYRMPSQLSKESSVIYRAMGIKRLKRPYKHSKEVIMK